MSKSLLRRLQSQSSSLAETYRIARFHNAALAITKQYIEMAMREMLERLSAPEERRAGLAPYLAGRFDLDRDLVTRFLNLAMEEERCQPQTPEGRETNEQFAEREAKIIMDSADAQCFRWLLKHHSGTGKAIAGTGMRCWIGGVEFNGEDVRDAIDAAMERSTASDGPTKAQAE